MKLLRFQSLVLLACLLGVLFRFGALGSKIVSHDEAYTSLRAAGYTGSEAIDAIWHGRVITRNDIRFFLSPNDNKDVFDTLSVIARSEPQLSPLYYIFAHYWMRLIGSSAAAMRGLAALLSLFAIPGMYWVSLELFKSQKTALLSVVFISLSPFSILMAQDSRAYSLWAAITLLSSAAFLTAIRKNTMLAWVIYSLTIVIGLYSHVFFALVAIAHGLYLLAVAESRSEGRFTRYLAASILAILAFTPWLFQMLIRWDFMMSRVDVTTSSVSLLHIQRWVTIFASPFLDIHIGPRNIVPYLLRIPVLLLLGYALLSVVKNTHKRIWIFLLLLIGITALPLLLSDLLRGGILSIQGRYFVSANVAIIPVVANWLASKLFVPGATSASSGYLATALLLAAQIGSAFNILVSETWWTKRLTYNDPEVGHVLNLAERPLLIVNGLAPTDLGDILALSFSVDEAVRFQLYQQSTVVELPLGFSDVYWFQQTYRNFINSESAKEYKAVEVVPYLLWRIDHE
jgi:uncharacterized membrane protein